MSNQYSSGPRTGEVFDADGKDVPAWCVINDAGSVITFANTRSYARQFADHRKGERIAQVLSVAYRVSK